MVFFPFNLNWLKNAIDEVMKLVELLVMLWVGVVEAARPAREVQVPWSSRGYSTLPLLPNTMLETLRSLILLLSLYHSSTVSLSLYVSP